jgi:hypothetical protein
MKSSFVCPPGKLRLVQEMYYSANDKMYDKYFDAAMQAFGSMVWEEE